MLKLTANLEMCQGYANCVVAADDAFDIDDDGLVVLLKHEVPEEERARLEAAVRTCPVSALSIGDR
ncbi:ferredoxin [Saccharopolyspora sp. K220]|uniref:ferredoxin n=1 Tax=Saccharopolyspora soli TaxID=2926618 RepID=UPI001F55D1D3|nr:ferredoxin [Saccharopolyspora soli]MCI2418358.1 ferredoxin [Saccharopolyspora soli]